MHGKNIATTRRRRGRSPCRRESRADHTCMVVPPPQRLCIACQSECGASARQQTLISPLSDTMDSEAARNLNGDGDEHRNSLLRRSWHAMSDILSPFSPSALASLPKKTLRKRPRYTRNDNVPEAESDEHGQMPTVRDYHAINSVPPQVRVPKKIATPIKVEGKVWFANERSVYRTIVVCGLNNPKPCSMDRILEHGCPHRDARSCPLQRLEG